MIRGRRQPASIRRMAARICPQCSTRVDERRAQGSPYCLSCGGSLGSASPNTFGSAPAKTTFGKAPAKGSALPWILGGIGFLVVLGFAGVVLLFVLAAASGDAKPDPTPPVAVAAPAAPKVELPDASPDAAPIKVAGTAPIIKTPAPQPTPTRTVTVVTPPPTIRPPTPPPTATDTAAPPFPRARANSELDRIASGLASCKRAEGPFGTGTIRVQFEPDGRTRVFTRPPFSSNPVATCIGTRFGAIRLGTFDGAAQSIERSFIIQE